MRLPLVLALAVLAAGVTDADARDTKRPRSEKSTKTTKRKGKVVRVERSRLAGGGNPRLCTNVQPTGSATCFVVPPQVGEIGQVLDDSGWKASVRVTAVTPVVSGCSTPSNFEVSIEVRSGDISQLTYNTQPVLVFDWQTSPRSKAFNQYYGGYGQSPVPIPGQRPGEMLLGAIDDEADGTADYIVSWYYCDASKAPTTSYGQGGMYCFVNYVRDGAGYVERRIDIGCY